MAKFIKKRFPILFVGTYFIVALSMVGFLIYPAIFSQASIDTDFTNNGAATATFGPSYADRLVLDVTIPDAWSGGAYTADILYWDAGNVDNWQGDTLNAFPALGTTTGVGYVEDLVDVGFQITETVVADLDADSVVTSAADDLIDGDGSADPGAGTVNGAAAAGDPLTAMGNDIGHGGVAICTDSTPYGYTAVRIDLDGDCTNNGSNDGTYVLGTNATAAGTEVTAQWAFGDAVTMGGNNDGDYDDGEDIFVENNIGELTYSAGADGNYIVGAGVGSVISDFPADCDGVGAGSEACKYTGAGAFDGNSNIYIDDGTAGGAAPNSVVDRQDDIFTGIGVQNTGTAVDTTDIAAVEVWADAGAVGFQGLGTDTPLGTMTVNSGDTKEWRLGGLAQAVAATVGQRIFVTVDLTATPTNGRTLKFQIPVYNDVDLNGVAIADGDIGVFMGSTNDGPTNAVVLNDNTQTIDSAGPTISSRVTADDDANGKIDRIIFTTNENLDDDFVGLAIDVSGYLGEAYITGDSANDNIFVVTFFEGASMDSDATPDTQITANTSLGDAYANDIAVDGAPVAATDGAAPVIETITYKDNDGDGKIDRITLTYSETVTAGSFLSANDLTFGNVGDFTSADFGTDGDDLITGAVLSTDINLMTEASVIDTRDDSGLLAVSTQNAFLLTDGTTPNSNLGNQTQATYVDGAAPVLDDVNNAPFYLDGDVDGSIETFQTWWSENVTMTGSTADDWAIVGGDLSSTFSAAADDAGGDVVIYVTVTSVSDRTGATVAPTIAYDNDDTGDSIKDAALNPAGTTGPVTLIDAASPLPVSAAYKDATGDGTVDRIDITMTAEAGFVCNFDAGDWSIPVAGTVGANTPSACVVSGNDLQIAVAATSDITGGAVSPQITYSNVAPKGSLTDLGGLNQATSFAAPVTATDAAAPFPVSAVYQDNDNDGTVERIAITMSTDSSTACTFEAADWSVPTDGDIGVNTPSACVGFAFLNTIWLTVAADNHETGGAVDPAVRYQNLATAGSIQDAFGNATGDFGVAGVSATDEAIPTIGTVTYKDADGDGMIDQVTLTYTETVVAASVVSANDLIFDDVGDFTGIDFGADANDLVTGSVASTDVDLDTEATVITTHDDSGTIAISTQNAFSLVDGNANTTLLQGSQTQATFADGAAPIVTSRVTTDADSDGEIDRVIFTTSENLDDDFTGLTTDISGYVGEAYATGGGANDTIFWVNFTESGAIDTSATPDTQITANTSLSDAYTNNIDTDSVVVASTDGALPILIGGSYRDFDSDGEVDTLRVTWSEAVTMTDSVVDDWTIGGGALNATFFDAPNAGPGTDIDLTVTADPDETGSATDVTIDYNNDDGDDSVVDAALNPADATGPVTLIDLAAPILVSSSPADNATGVALDANFILTFSEQMTAGSVSTTTVGRSPSFSLGGASWNGAGTAVTYSAHDPWAGLQIYTITLGATIASSATTDGDIDLTAVVPNPFDFTTVAATTGGGGGGAGLPASVAVLSPNGGEVWAGSSSKNITWSSTSSAITKVKLFYSLDRGVNFPYIIATDENNDGTYSWTVPNIPSGTVKVKVEGYDASNIFVASDISDADFTITYTTPPPPGAETPSGTENLAGLLAGDLLKSPMSTTVYYYGSDNKRHIFPNEKTYKTWYPDWSNVRSVTAEELREIPLGENVTVRPGTVLVKIDTDPKVYAVELNGLLRWIPTEERIKILYGEDWAKKIIDVPLAFWGDYSFGSDISTDTHPTGALVQYSGTTETYYIQGAEKRKITTAGFAANNFRSEYVVVIPTTLYYAPGVDITGSESVLTSIY